jgi:hypothetical protein
MAKNIRSPDIEEEVLASSDEGMHQKKLEGKEEHFVYGDVDVFL